MPEPVETQTPRPLDEESVYRARMDGQLLSSGTRYRLIDAFSGAGGMTLGFTGAFGHVFEPVWANDWNEYAADTYNANFGDHCTTGDIVEFLETSATEIPRADVVIGGPPCQGFSLLNKNRVDDPRKQLWRPFLDIVERSGARVFVMENVPQLLGSPEQAKISDVAADMGFNSIAFGKLCAADYGVSQVRWRAFLIGCRDSDPWTVFPVLKTHFKPDSPEENQLPIRRLPDAEPWRTLRDTIGDLPSPDGLQIRDEPPPLDLHFGRNPTELSRRRYRVVSEEGMNRETLLELAPELTPKCWVNKKGGTDLFGRLWWDRPAFTIRTEFFKPEKGRYLHPVEHRPITHREAARIQSFPDTFRFKGTKIEIAKQIGNAVPPMLAARVADAVYALLMSK